ncbi:MAG: tyrosine-type recombinase/integrase [Antarcticimicrobium sp.]|uniref:tyrosine-type recombinase/integrase n=1 Tax=Antarcticimicrobium sp. TaxID=2824147 RepID=UPI0026139DDD|nr:tyrosine-type recombinase/integrase [Antarcticimicrobium sp.]MDF1716176.1 tyrosine-type recombinase/integrase [Antarcticimicrobium sp.]
MPHTKITQAFVEGLPFHDSTDWYHDTELAGFNLSVGRRSKTYYAAAENDGRFMRVKIGRADVTKANEARAVARDILLPEIRRGVDPRSKYFDDAGDTAYARIMRGIRMSDDKADLALRGRRKKGADNVTVGHVWAMYEEHHLARMIEERGPEKANRAKKHVAEQRRYLGGAESYGKDGPPASTMEWPDGWWNRPITSITPELCSQTWRNLSRTRGRRTAQLFFMAVKVLLNYAVAKEEVPVTSHPMVIDIAGDGRGLPKGWQSLRAQNAVERISDIRAWWRQVDKLTVIPKSALKVALLTGMRPSEVLTMRWENVDLDAGKVWFGMTKTTDYREVALSSWSVAQLKRLQSMSGRHEYVFTGPTGGRLQSLPTIKRGADRWTPKQCRKEWQTVAVELGVSDTQRLSQVGKGLGGTDGHYVVTPDLRSTVQQVADEIMRRVEGAAT